MVDSLQNDNFGRRRRSSKSATDYCRDPLLNETHVRRQDCTKTVASPLRRNLVGAGETPWSRICGCFVIKHAWKNKDRIRRIKAGTEQLADKAPSSSLITSPNVDVQGAAAQPSTNTRWLNYHSRTATQLSERSRSAREDSQFGQASGFLCGRVGATYKRRFRYQTGEALRLHT